MPCGYLYRNFMFKDSHCENSNMPWNDSRLRKLFIMMVLPAIRVLDWHTAGVVLCVSAVLAVGRCPSVHPSVTLVYCIQTVKVIVKIISESASAIILVCWSHPMLSFKGLDNNNNNNNNNRISIAPYGRNFRGADKVANFDWDCRLSQKQYDRVPWLLWNVNGKS